MILRKNTHALLSFFALIGLAVSKAQETEMSQAMVCRWNFESQEAPWGNSAMAAVGDRLKPSKEGIRIENGIAKLETHGTLEYEATRKHRIAPDATYWFRAFISPDSGSGTPWKSGEELELFSKGSLAIKALFSESEDAGSSFQISGAFNGADTTFLLEPGMNPVIPAGIWFQMALTLEKNEEGAIARLYYYSENSSFGSKQQKRNYWVYLGRYQMGKEAVATDYSFKLGNDHSQKNGGALWIDEVRVYSRPTDLVNLYKVRAGIRGIPDVSENPPGTVIDYSPAFTGRYVAGSPAIVVLEDGTYIAKGDDYGPAVGKSELARIYRSEDKGATWEEISQVEGITWASLFVHRGALYMLGTSAGHGLGHGIIVKSLDGGLTWTTPTDSENGMIFSDLSYHTAPGPVVVHNGRIWKAMEDEKGVGGWGTNFRAFLMSADIDSDLLKAESWVTSDALAYNPGWLDGTFNGWLEGNAVPAPNGHMVNILRVSRKKGGGTAAIISYTPDGKRSSFDPERDFVDFPGGSTKFHIRYDEESGLYWALSNGVPEKHQSPIQTQATIRNTLVLMTSPDLYDWKIRDILLYHPDIAQVGFQYPTFAFDGDDLIYVSRTAYEDSYGGAAKQHDVNYFTFHRIPDFRKKYAEKP